MALITPTVVSQITSWGNNVVTFTWAGITAGSTMKAVSGPGWVDRSIQVEGTFSAASTITAQGSNDSTNFHTLHDPFSNLISFAAAGLTQIIEVTNNFKPVLTGGDGTTSLTVTLTTRNSQPPL